MTLLLPTSLWGSSYVSPVKKIDQKKFLEILQNYQFVDDFNQKPEITLQKKYPYRKYPVKLTPPTFSFDPVTDDKKKLLEYFPQTKGDGLAITHINKGRNFFIEGDYISAFRTWMSAKERYKKEYDYHRRTDYFLAYAFLNVAISIENTEVSENEDSLSYGIITIKKKEGDKNSQEQKDVLVKTNLLNASTFFAWAYQLKKQIPDPIVEQLTATSLYNLAVIYFKYKKWSPAYSAARDGLFYLRSTGEKSKRSSLRRLLAETYIRNRSYYEAVEQLDIALRQDPNPKEAVQIFGRVADIYFDLNNYDLAADSYKTAIQIDELQGKIDPNYYALRGESLFWVKRYKEALTMFQFALKSQYLADTTRDLAKDLQAISSIRVADINLALGNKEKSKLEYFKHISDFKKDITTIDARVKLACLELPEYQKNNVKHARKLLNNYTSYLEENKKDYLPEGLLEMAYSCDTMSYVQRDTDEKVLEKVKIFAKKFPDSKTLNEIRPKIKKIRADEIMPLFEKDFKKALIYFETNRDLLYTKIPDEMKRKLFFSYVKINQSSKAKEFYKKSYTKTDDLEKLLLLADYFSEESYPSKSTDKIQKKLLAKIPQIQPTKQNKAHYQRIFNFDQNKYFWPLLNQLSLAWSQKDVSYFCSHFMPNYNQKPSLPNKKLIEKIQKRIQKALPDLMRFETNCAYSALDLEYFLNKNNMLAYSEILLNRKYIPVNSDTAKYFFQIASELNDQNKPKQARKIWNYIIDNADKNASSPIIEVNLSKKLLKKFETEYEKLW